MFDCEHLVVFALLLYLTLVAGRVSGVFTYHAGHTPTTSTNHHSHHWICLLKIFLFFINLFILRLKNVNHINNITFSCLDGLG